MARSLCSCGEEILWKADEPQSDEWRLLAAPDIGGDPWAALGAAASGAFCSNCGHLWVAWGHTSTVLSEYAPVDPSVRPRRR